MTIIDKIIDTSKNKRIPNKIDAYPEQVTAQGIGSEIPAIVPKEASVVESSPAVQNSQELIHTSTPNIAQMNMGLSSEQGPEQAKSSVSEEQYKIMESLGYPREEVDRLMSPYDPSRDNYSERIFRSSITQPAKPDEKQIKKARLIAGITDALGGASQILSLYKGAHLKERNDFAGDRVSKREKELRDTYAQQLDNHEKGLLGARLNDWKDGLARYEAKGKAMRDDLQNHLKLQESQRQADMKIALAREKADGELKTQQQKLELQLRKLEDDAKYRKGQLGIGWKNAETARMRAEAYTLKGASGSSKTGLKSNETLLQVPANINDSSTHKDALGNPVKEFVITKAEVQSLAEQAKSDKSFLDVHPEMYSSRPDATGSGKLTYQSNDVLAWWYLKHLYDSGFFGPNPDTSPRTLINPFLQIQSDPELDAINATINNPDLLGDVIVEDDYERYVWPEE